MPYQHLLLDGDGLVAWVTLNRRQVHHALNDMVIAEVRTVVRVAAAAELPGSHGCAELGVVNVADPRSERAGGWA